MLLAALPQRHQAAHLYQGSDGIGATKTHKLLAVRVWLKYL